MVRKERSLQSEKQYDILLQWEACECVCRPKEKKNRERILGWEEEKQSMGKFVTKITDSDIRKEETERWEKTEKRIKIWKHLGTKSRKIEVAYIRLTVPFQLEKESARWAHTQSRNPGDKWLQD